MTTINPTNQRAEQRSRVRQERMWAAVERAYIRPLAKEYKRYGSAVAGAVRSGGIQGLPLLEITSDHQQRVEKILGSLYNVSTRDSATLIIRDAGKTHRHMLIVKDLTTAFQQFQQLWILNEALEKSTTIAATSKTRAIAVIGTGVAEGMSQFELARSLTNAFGPGFARGRAALTARTETHASSQSSSLFTAGNIDFGTPMHKRWVAASDSRTRSSHEDLNRDTVPMDELFQPNKPPKLRFPGDPRGAASEVINCRCALVYVEPER